MTLAYYNATYTEKQLVWTGFDLGWSAIRTFVLVGSGILLFIFIGWLVSRM